MTRGRETLWPEEKTERTADQVSLCRRHWRLSRCLWAAFSNTIRVKQWQEKRAQGPSGGSESPQGARQCCWAGGGWHSAFLLNRGEAEREGSLLAGLVKSVGRTGRQRCATQANPSILGGRRRVLSWGVVGKVHPQETKERAGPGWAQAPPQGPVHVHLVPAPHGLFLQ